MISSRPALTPIRRTSYGFPFPLQSPADSGYGTNSSPVKCSGLYFDGAASPSDDCFSPYSPGTEDDEDGIKEDSPDLILVSPPESPTKGAVLASHLKSSRDKIRRKARRLRKTGANTPGSLHSLDRFVPIRNNSTPTFQRIRTSKPTHQLSPSEKLLRHDSASTDPFLNNSGNMVSTLSEFRLTHARSRDGLVPNDAHGFVTVLRPLSLNYDLESARHAAESYASFGTVWNIGGGLVPSGTAVDDGRGRLFGSGTSAPVFASKFASSRFNPEYDIERHQARIAKALEIDCVSRILKFDALANQGLDLPKVDTAKQIQRTSWNGAEWTKKESLKAQSKSHERVIPNSPFRVLNAPRLRDDFYCSTLAYSPTCSTLIVGLGNVAYAWTDTAGVKQINGLVSSDTWITSVAFSSNQGGKSILAIGRNNGLLSLVSLYDSLLPRFEIHHAWPIVSLNWRPVYTSRPSVSPHVPGTMVRTEDLLVGDDHGNIYYYIVEWPASWEVQRDMWSGSVQLVARILAHNQQVCGLAWSPNGQLFATRGNDNSCCLFDVSQVVGKGYPRRGATKPKSSMTAAAAMCIPNIEVDSPLSSHPMSSPTLSTTSSRTIVNNDDEEQGHTGVRTLLAGSERHRWMHSAAVKAIAFCPWRDSLVATGGGSNDRCIHFYHTSSGAALAFISVEAQVTSLVWSNTRREIAVTLGYAEPAHRYRIAVFSWPECQQVAAVAWETDHRALYAVPYPNMPLRPCGTDQASSSGNYGLDGCLVVAASDSSVKFHEIWPPRRKLVDGTGEGMLGGSEVLEGLEGIDKEDEIIR